MIQATLALLLAVAIAVAGCGHGEGKPASPSGDVAASMSSAISRGRDATPAAIAELAATLTAADPNARRDAAFGLGIAANMDPELSSIAPALVAAASREEDPRVQRAIYWALGRCADESAVAPLSRALRSLPTGADVAVAAEAGLALAVLGRSQIALDDVTRANLVALAASTERDARYAGSLALAREHEPPVDPVALRTLEALAGDADAEVRAAALVGLARRRRGKAAFTIALDDPDWRVSVEAARGLLALKSPAALGALGGWVERSVRDKKIRPHPMRAALEGFAELGDIDAVRRAADSVLGDRHGGTLTLDDGQLDCLAQAVRVPASGGLEALRRCGASAVPAWWRASVIARAIVASKRVGLSDQIRALTELATNADPRVRAAAIGLVGKLGTTVARKDAIKLVRDALSDESVAVAGTAADAITLLAPDPSELAELAAIIVPRARHELAGHSELGLTLINAIAASKMIAGKELCQAATTHGNRTIRAAARGCLEALGSDASVRVAKDPPRLAPADVVSTPAHWRLETTRGTIAIALEPAVAPRHVAAVIKLTSEKFYDGLTFHRVVANFVVQGGDPTGTGWGGPDFTIPAEPSPLPFDRGAVGIADAGPDTGGSQLFIMHTRAPRLEGRYTRIGRVIEGQAVVDALAVGDSIKSASIESGSR